MPPVLGTAKGGLWSAYHRAIAGPSRSFQSFVQRGVSLTHCSGHTAGVKVQVTSPANSGIVSSPHLSSPNASFSAPSLDWGDSFKHSDCVSETHRLERHVAVHSGRRPCPFVLWGWDG